MSMRDLDEIRIQEMYREKARVRYQQQSQPESNTLKFLNSNLGIFLLSSVAVALFSWGYNQWTNHLRDEKESEKAYEKLSLEVMNRLRYFDKLTTTFEYDDRRVIQQALHGFDPTANVNPSWLRHYSAIFPEYQQRSLESLIWELERLSKPDRRNKLRQARKKVELIDPYFEKLQYWEVKGEGKGPDAKIGMYALKSEDQNRLRAEILNSLEFLKDPSYFLPD